MPDRFKSLETLKMEVGQKGAVCQDLIIIVAISTHDNVVMECKDWGRKDKFYELVIILCMIYFSLNFYAREAANLLLYYIYPVMSNERIHICNSFEPKHLLDLNSI